LQANRLLTPPVQAAAQVYKPKQTRKSNRVIICAALWTVSIQETNHQYWQNPENGTRAKALQVQVRKATSHIPTHARDGKLSSCADKTSVMQNQQTIHNQTSRTSVGSVGRQNPARLARLGAHPVGVNKLTQPCRFSSHLSTFPSHPPTHPSLAQNSRAPEASARLDPPCVTVYAPPGPPGAIRV
jgi:hypothetical protein